MLLPSNLTKEIVVTCTAILKWITNKVLLYSTGNCSMLCGSLERRGVAGRMDTRIYMAESLCCPPETITTLLISYWSWARLSDFTFPLPFRALEKEMATHSSVLAWRIPGTGEPGGLPSMGSHRVGHDRSDLAAATAYPNIK